YEPFLARAKEDQAHVGKRKRIVVKAPAAGYLEPHVRRHDEVEAGDALATYGDPRAWVLTAEVSTRSIHPGWSCAVLAGSGSERAPCSIERIEVVDGKVQI